MQWDGSVGGRIGITQIAGKYTNFQYTGFRNHASAIYDRGILKLTAVLPTGDDLKVQAGYVHFSALNPGSLTLQESLQNPGMADPLSISNAAGQSGYQGQASTVWKHPEKDSSFFKLTLYDITRSVDNPIIGKIVILPQNSGGMDFLYGFRTRIGNILIPWTAGTEMAFRLNHRKNYVNNEGVKGMIVLKQDEQIIGTGIYIQALVPVSKDITIHGSMRFDLTYFGVRNRLLETLPSWNSGSRIMNGLSPSVGLVYRGIPDMNLFVNYSTSFETPTSTELANRQDQSGGFNPDLNPSHAIEFETGIRGKYYSLVQYDLTGFLIQSRDELVPYQIPSYPGQYFYRNAAATGRRGIEIALGYQPLKLLSLTLTTNFMNAFYNKYTLPGTNYSGNKIPGINQYRQVFEIRLHAQQGWYCSTQLQGFGPVYTDDANSAKTKPYILTDFSLGRDDLSIGKKRIHTFRFSAGLSNAFSIRYTTAVTINDANSKYYEPGPGRSVYFNLSWVFGKS
jgi:iron complex outermembrane receptor protein